MGRKIKVQRTEVKRKFMGNRKMPGFIRRLDSAWKVMTNSNMAVIVFEKRHKDRMSFYTELSPMNAMLVVREVNKTLGEPLEDIVENIKEVVLGNKKSSGPRRDDKGRFARSNVDRKIRNIFRGGDN